MIGQSLPKYPPLQPVKSPPRFESIIYPTISSLESIWSRYRAVASVVFPVRRIPKNARESPTAMPNGLLSGRFCKVGLQELRLDVRLRVHMGNRIVRL